MNVAPELMAAASDLAGIGSHHQRGVIGHSTTAGYRWAWQTKAWSNGEREPAAVLYQEVVNSPSNPGPLLGGINVDVDQVLAADFGQWDFQR